MHDPDLLDELTDAAAAADPARLTRLLNRLVRKVNRLGALDVLPPLALRETDLGATLYLPNDDGGTISSDTPGVEPNNLFDLPTLRVTGPPTFTPEVGTRPTVIDADAALWWWNGSGWVATGGGGGGGAAFSGASAIATGVAVGGAGTFTVHFGTEAYDTGSYFTLGAGAPANTLCTIPADGVYAVHVRVRWYGAAAWSGTVDLHATLLTNGATAYDADTRQLAGAGPLVDTTQPFAVEHQFLAGDQLSVTLLHRGAAVATLSADVALSVARVDGGTGGGSSTSTLTVTDSTTTLTGVDTLVVGNNLTLTNPGTGSARIDGTGGGTGPAVITGSTSTTLTGILKGDGAAVGTVTVGTGLSYTAGTLSSTVTQYTDEQAQDAAAAAVANTGRVQWTYNDALNQLSADLFNYSVADQYLRYGAGTSVIGRAAGGASGPVADITATADGQVLIRDAGAFNFRALAPADAGAQPLDADLTSLAAASGTNALYYRSAANTWAPVTVGAGLTFSGGTLNAPGSGGTATGGGLTWLGEVTVGAPGAGSVSFAVPAGYRHLELRYVARCDSAGAQALQVQVNGDTGANYDWQYVSSSGSSGVSAVTSARCGSVPGSGAPAGSFAQGTLCFQDYTNTATMKTFTAAGGRKDTATGLVSEATVGWWRTSGSAVTGLAFFPGAGNFVQNTRFTLYGLADAGGTSGLPVNSVTNAQLRDSLATSVIGRAPGTAGDPADIQATADGQVLIRDAGALTFRALAPADAGAQPLDADLTSLAAASGTNALYYRSAANTWGAVTVGAGLSFAGGTLAANLALGMPTSITGIFQGNGSAVSALTVDASLSYASGILSLPASGVTAGSYRAAAVTLDAKGRVTAATNGRELVGYGEVQTDQGTSSTTDVDLATADSATFTLPVAGDVLVRYTSIAYNTVASSNCISTIYLDGVSTGVSYAPGIVSASVGLQHDIQVRLVGLAAGAHTVSVKHRTGNAAWNAHWFLRSLVVSTL